MKEQNPIITIRNGRLQGLQNLDWKGQPYYSFQGIPYGKPPINELRFKAPLPAEPWHGIKDATKEGNISYARDFFKNIVGSEDCLFLNVYTPELPSSGSKLKPVMVFIHGGGFTNGSGNSTPYGPEFLVSEDIVLVTINYRLGLLGFANFEDSSLGIPGNAGFKDQVLSLKWVQENIRYFCGDHNNVTIFGESAGGCSVHNLMLSTMAKGLFHRVIAQSGVSTSLWALAQRTAPLLSKALGLPNTDEQQIVKILQSLPVEKLFELQEKLPDPFMISVSRPFGLVVETSTLEPTFLSEHPCKLLKSGQFSRVPLMIGYTSREGILLHTQFKGAGGKMIWNGDFEDVVPYDLNLQRGSQISKTVADKIQEFYFGNETPSIENIDHYYVLQGDNFFFLSINNCARYHSAISDSPVFYYRFSADTKLNIYKGFQGLKERGASHGDELGYLFKNIMTPNLRPKSFEDVTLRRMLRFWTNFARYGDPNPIEKDSLINITWPPIKHNELHYLDIGENLTVGLNPEAERVEFWDNIYNIQNPKSHL